MGDEGSDEGLGDSTKSTSKEEMSIYGASQKDIGVSTLVSVHTFFALTILESSRPNLSRRH